LSEFEDNVRHLNMAFVKGAKKNGLPHLSHRLERHQGSIQGVLAGAKNIAKPEKRKWQLMPIRINDMIDMYSTK